MKVKNKQNLIALGLVLGLAAYSLPALAQEGDIAPLKRKVGLREK